MILCSISTRGRYFTTLPMAIMAVANQTRPVDKLVIFDDNDDPRDLRTDNTYSHLFQILNQKGIKWEWLYAAKKGQHHNHQMANTMGYEWVWRVDDDAIPEPNVLENLFKHTADDVGAVGGSILMGDAKFDTSKSTGKIEDIDKEPNIQWAHIKEVKRVEHLHCSFLYRAGIVDYNLGLSRVAHREETLFSYALHKRGYKVLVVPEAVVWHLKSSQGGIRAETDPSMYIHDEAIFRNFLAYKDKTIVVLNCGMGDHIVFSHVLPDLKDVAAFTCYPDIVPGDSIAKAQELFGDIDMFSVYRKMDQWKWKDSLEKAYRKMYL